MRALRRQSHDAWLNSGNPLDEVTDFDISLNSWLDDCPVQLSVIVKDDIGARVRLELRANDEGDAG